MTLELLLQSRHVKYIYRLKDIWIYSAPRKVDLKRETFCNTLIGWLETSDKGIAEGHV